MGWGELKVIITTSSTKSKSIETLHVVIDCIGDPKSTKSEWFGFIKIAYTSPCLDRVGIVENWIKPQKKVIVTLLKQFLDVLGETLGGLTFFILNNN